jgi:hypothetical protein
LRWHQQELAPWLESVPVSEKRNGVSTVATASLGLIPPLFSMSVSIKTRIEGAKVSGSRWQIVKSRLKWRNMVAIARILERLRFERGILIPHGIRRGIYLSSCQWLTHAVGVARSAIIFVIAQAGWGRTLAAADEFAVVIGRFVRAGAK